MTNFACRKRCAGAQKIKNIMETGLELAVLVKLTNIQSGGTLTKCLSDACVAGSGFTIGFVGSTFLRGYHQKRVPRLV